MNGDPDVVGKNSGLLLCCKHLVCLMNNGFLATKSTFLWLFFYYRFYENSALGKKLPLKNSIIVNRVLISLLF